MGFEPIKDAEDIEAGLLMPAPDPALTLAKQRETLVSADITQRPKIQPYALHSHSWRFALESSILATGSGSFY
jgi:hypothetical protein